MHSGPFLAPSPFSHWMISCTYRVVLFLSVSLLLAAVHGLLPGEQQELCDNQIYIHRPGEDGGIQQSLLLTKNRPGVLALTLLYTIFDVKGNPFVHLSYKMIPIPHTYGRNTASLF